MISTTIAMYLLGGIIVVLSGLLVTRTVKRRQNKPENIWEVSSTNSSQYSRIPSNVPVKAPPANVFYNR